MKMNNEIRNKLERGIVRLLVVEMGKAGFVPVTVWNGEEYAPQGVAHRNSDDLVPARALTVDEVIEHVFSVDDSTLHFAPASNLEGWGSHGVMLVGGNAQDIISDYHFHGDDSAFSKAVDAVQDRIENGELTFV